MSKFSYFQLINKVIPIRMKEHEELLGADFFAHDVRPAGVGVSRAVSVLAHFYPADVDRSIQPAAGNPGNYRVSLFGQYQYQ